MYKINSKYQSEYYKYSSYLNMGHSLKLWNFLHNYDLKKNKIFKIFFYKVFNFYYYVKKLNFYIIIYFNLFINI